MVNYKKYTIGFLLLLVSASIVYISLNDTVKMRVDEDKTTFYIKELDANLEPYGRWLVSGREYNSLMDGSSKLNRDVSNIMINTSINNITNITTIKRITPYQRGPVIIDTYRFNSSVSDLELFPVSHEINILNGSDFYYRYEVKDLIYDGDTFKLENKTVLKFGRRMNLELQPDYRWAWVYSYGGVRAQYEIPSNNYTFKIRLFDPLDNPVTRFNDTFVESSDTALQIHTPTETGTSWVRESDSTGAADYIVIASTNLLQIAANGNEYVTYTITDDIVSDTYAVTMTLTTVDSSDDYAHLLGRYVDKDNTYVVTLSSTTGSSELKKIVGGTVTVLDTATDGLSNGDIITLELTNFSKTVYKNGNIWLSSSDNSVTGKGTAGISCGEFSETSGSDCTATWKLDDFTVVSGDAIVKPFMEQVEIFPDPPTYLQNVEGYCNATEGTNSDVAYYYRWYRNGVLNTSGFNNNGGSNFTQGILINVNNISSTITSVGESWFIECKATDGDYNSTWLNSSDVIIADDTPVIESSRIEPLLPTDTDNLVGFCNASDANSDNIYYEYKWYKDSVEFEYKSVGVFICFQEFTNQGTFCGGLDTGTYTVSGDWSGSSNIYDGNYLTFADSITDPAYIVINYTKPRYVINTSTWLAYIGYLGGPVNYTIPNTCWNQFEDKVSFQIISTDSDDASRAYCRNSTGWEFIAEVVGSLGRRVYEEAIYWRSDGFVSGSELNVGNVSNLNVSGNQNWTLSCRANDGETFSDWVNTSVIIESSSTCICPGLNQNWTIDLTEFCELNDACNLGIGKLNFSNTGYATCNNLINTSNLGDPRNANTFFINSSCIITIN